MARDVRVFVRSCDLCQRAKAPNRSLAGPLQPLQVASGRWTDISMDFLTGLPPSGVSKFDAILTVVCRATKRVHFIPTHATVSAEQTVQLFLDNVFRLHGLPSSIVSDRDARFTARFWSVLMAKLGVKLHLSTANHPQTDGQSERAHRSLLESLRMFVAHQQSDWVEKLSVVEFAHNNLTNGTTGFSPFLLDLGFHPRMGLFDSSVALPLSESASSPSTSTSPAVGVRAEVVERFLAAQRSSLQQAVDAIRGAQELARTAATSPGATHGPVPFHVGDLVLVHRDALISPAQRARPSKKLGFPWQGPFPVLSVPSPNVCKLRLPNIRAHPVINNTFLKLYVPNSVPDRTQPPPPPVLVGEQPEWAVEDILDHRLYRGKSWQFLVKWVGLGVGDISWEPARNLVDDGVVNERLLAYSVLHPEVRACAPPAVWLP